MRSAFLLALFGSVLATSGTIGYEVTSLGGNEYQYSYFLSGFSFNQNEAFDIQFNPALYADGSLISGVAGSSFTLSLLQPNSPFSGNPGDYEAESNVNGPSLAGPFTVDFSYSGVGLPGPQSYVLEQFDSNNIFIDDVGSGTTTAVPEPGALSLAGLGLFWGCAVGWLFRRRQMRPDTTGGPVSPMPVR
jgi:hypothetical protein